MPSFIYARVSILITLVLFLASCSQNTGGSGEEGGSGTPDGRGGEIVGLQVYPSAFIFTAPEQELTLEVVAIDADGNLVELTDEILDWHNTSSPAISLDRHPAEAGKVLITARDSVGSAVVTASLNDELWSNPVSISVASVMPEVQLIPDADVLFPAVGSPDTVGPASLVNTADIAGFSDAELSAFLEVRDGWLAFPVILAGAAPVVDGIVLGQGGSAIMGRVLQVVSRNGNHLVQLEQVPFTDAFDDFVYSFNSEALINQRVLDPGWGDLLSGDTLTTSALSNCSITGGGRIPDIDAVLETEFTTIFEIDLDVRSGYFKFVAGIKTEVDAGLGIDLQLGLTGTISCDVGSPFEVAVDLPGNIVTAAFSLEAQFQPQVELTAELDGGPRFSGRIDGGLESLVKVGFEIHNWVQFVNLSDRTVEPYFTNGFDVAGWDDWSWSVSFGAFAEGALGIQIGGRVLSTTCAVTRNLPLLGEGCKEIEDALFQEALIAKIGMELPIERANSQQVVTLGESTSRASVNAIAALELGNKSLNDLLKKFGFAPIELELASLELEMLSLYRSLIPDSITVVSPDYSGVLAAGSQISARPGDVIDFEVVGAFKPGAVIPGTDSPLYAGEAWLGRTGSFAIAADVEDGVLSFSLTVTEAACGFPGTDGQEIHFLGFNRLFELISMPNYLGNLQLACEPVEGADLAVGNLSVTPETAPVGSDVTVSFVIYNQGDTTANASQARISINTNPDGVTGNDEILDNLIATPQMAAGASQPFSRTVTIPASLAEGEQYIWVITDVNNEAGQSNLENDTASAPIGLFVSACNSGDANNAVDPCVVTRMEQLQSIADNPNGHYALGSDLDASVTADWNDGSGFRPIGTDDNRFAGTFDGRDYSITGLTVTPLTNEPAGLFGVIGESGEVRNLRLAGGAVNVNTGAPVGALAGINHGLLEHVTSGTSVFGLDLVGGLVGMNHGQIDHGYSSGEIAGPSVLGGISGLNDGKIAFASNSGPALVSNSADGLLGGIAGLNQSGGAIIDSVNTRTASGIDYVGGIVGINDGDIIRSSNVATSVSGSSYVGGLAGIHGAGVIESSSNAASVQAEQYVGGLAGLTSSGATIIYSYNLGVVSSLTDYSGGLAGINGGEIRDSYNLGTAGGSEYVGGMAGINTGLIMNVFNAGSVMANDWLGALVPDADSNLEASYYDLDTTGRPDTDAGFGMNTAGMHQQATYSGWDFGPVWTINEGGGYPDLVSNPR